MDIQQDVTIKSWDGTWTYHPHVRATPESVEDLVEIMTDPVRFPSPVRPAGSMHSTARMNGDEGGTMVDMKAMNRILHFTDDTVTVEAGVTHMQLANALKERGLQPYITTEIGNVTLAAMACAATKDSSFPGGFGQVSSYVTAVRLVTPQGEIREISEVDNPKEMQIIRSSYGLFGIIFEVTIKVRPTTAMSVRHYSLSIENFRKFFPIYRARGYAVMYYIFPYAKRVLVELRKDNPEAKPRSKYRWQYRNRFWRKYAPAVALWIQHTIPNVKLRRMVEDFHFYLLRQLLVWFVRSERTWPHAQIINYPRDPGENKYLFSMWAFREGGYFDILEEYCDFCIAYEQHTGYRCNLPSVGYAIARDVEAMFSYSWEGATLSIDPASTGGPEWEEFLHAYNDFCSERRGVPLFNQTPFLTREQVRRAFGARLQQFAARRKEVDPKNRMLDSYFRELLS
ncbi:MAG: FAD-binding protein [Methyloceanibacter sp.]|uniref:FAD-binding protein n=1 Tax=Methyloceanibacter sp. TaxID=1965321 RepID=UPI003D6CBE05